MEPRRALNFFDNSLLKVRSAGKIGSRMNEAIDSAYHKPRRQTRPRQQRIAEREGLRQKKVPWIRRNALKSPDSDE
jgi:hypothetical protein